MEPGFCLRRLSAMAKESLFSARSEGGLSKEFLIVIATGWDGTARHNESVRVASSECDFQSESTQFAPITSW